MQCLQGLYLLIHRAQHFNLRPRRWRRWLCCGALFFANLMALPSVAAGQEVTLQLRWEPQFQFAGFYAAKWNGYYEEVGLDVAIRPAVLPDGSIVQPVKEVATGRADFGVSAVDILQGIDQGYSLHILASYFQDSAVGFFTFPPLTLTKAEDFLSHVIAATPDDLFDVELRALIQYNGLDPKKLQRRLRKSALNDFLDGRIDVMTGYVFGIPERIADHGRQVNTVQTADFGLRMYGDTLFTSERMLVHNPETVRRFIDASRRGWIYALQHPDEMAEKIGQLQRVRPVSDPVAFNRKMAEQIKRLMDFPRVAPGHMTLTRWEQQAKTLFDAGILEQMPDMRHRLLNPERDFPSWWQRHWLWLVFLATVLTLSATTFHILRLRRAVVYTAKRVRRQDQEIQQQKAVMDSVFHHLPVGMAVFDEQGTTVRVNPAFDQISTINDTPVRLASDFWQRFLTDENDAMERTLATAQQTEGAYFQARKVRSSPTEKWVNIHWLPLPDHGLHVAMVNDISEAYHQRQITEMNERRFRSLFHHSAVATCEADWTHLFAALKTLQNDVEDLEAYLLENLLTVNSLVDTIVIKGVNKACLEMFDAKTQAELDERLGQVFHAESIQPFVRCILAIFHGHNEYRFKGRWLTLMGEQRWIDLCFVRLEGEDGSVTVLITLQNLTDLLNAQRTLEENQRRYEGIFRTAEIAIWDEDYRPILARFSQLREEGVTDLRHYLRDHSTFIDELYPQIKIHDVNPATVRLFGADSAEELIAKCAHTFTPQAIKVFEQVLCALWEQKESFNAEVRFRSLTGQDLRVLINLSLPRRIDQAAHVPVCMVDITSLREAQKSLRRQEAQYRKVFENAHVGIWDEDYSELYAEFERLRREGVTDLAAYLKEQPQAIHQLRSLVVVNEINRTGLKQLHAQTTDEVVNQLDKTWTEDAFDHYGRFLTALWQGDDSFSADCQYCTVDGLPIVLHVSVQVPKTKDDFDHVPICLVDVTSTRKIEAQLQQLSHVVHQTLAQVIITDISGRIEYVNPAFEACTGYPLDEIVGQTPRMVKSGYTAPQTYRELWQAITQGEVWQGELYNKRRNGDFYWVYASISPLINADGETVNYIAVMEDISRLKEQEMQLMLQAYYDELTGLPNRVLIMDRLEQAIKKSERDTSLMAVLFVDLDKFKDINDGLGHSVGDSLLVEAAGRIKHAVRASDTVGRFGGDEFVVLIDGFGSIKDVQHIAAKINKAFTEDFVVEGHELSTTASIGIATYPENGARVEDLLKSADAAMYKAKDDGRNTYHFFTSSMTSEASKRLDVETRLRHALERQDFFLEYQPLVDAERQQVVGAEALIRWQDPKLGLVGPDLFIPLAEGMGLIGNIGEWVMNQACHQAVQWQQSLNTRLTISVNVSPRQFAQGSLVESTRQALESSGLDPQLLVIEVTENLLILDHPEITENLQQLKALGVMLSVDDFGTGYSSLSYLKRYPFDALKIDRSFVKDLPESEDSATLVNAILAMAEGLGLRVVGEGVETLQQFDYLQQRNCSVCQGFYFSRPLSAEDFAAYCRQPAC